MIDNQNANAVREKRSASIISRFLTSLEMFQKQNEDSNRVANLALEVETSQQGSYIRTPSPVKEPGSMPDPGTDEVKDFDACCFYEKLELLNQRLITMLQQYDNNINNCVETLERINAEL